MSSLLDANGQPIQKKVDESQLPTVEQILSDPITKKFVFLNSEDYPDQTCIGLTTETHYAGVIYKYGKVTLPDESEIKVLGDHQMPLRLKFEYDIIENNGISRDKFGEEFFKLIGDILYHIIVTQSEVGQIEPDNRTDSTQ
jgi:hypothetical protein|tara:strand:- start:230 stop:652 length:423 start_codon:yes stop_codon:yes gene_type:complete